VLLHRLCVRNRLLLVSLSLHILILVPARVHNVILLEHANWLVGYLRMQVRRALLRSLVLCWLLHAQAVDGMLVHFAVQGSIFAVETLVIEHGRFAT